MFLGIEVFTFAGVAVLLFKSITNTDRAELTLPIVRMLLSVAFLFSMLYGVLVTGPLRHWMFKFALLVVLMC